MADIQFTFKFVPNRYEDKVQRAAVLYPLTKVCRGDAQVITQTAVLQRMWRARIGTLTGSGLELSDGARSAHYLRNCLPAFSYAFPRTTPCRWRTVCPFCYARWAAEVWHTVDHAFASRTPQSDGPASDRVFKYHAVEYTRNHVYKYQGDPQQLLTTLLSELTALRRSTVNRLNPSGAFYYDTVEPTKVGWRVRTRHLLMVPAGHVLPPGYGKKRGSRLLVHDAPTRKVLFGAVSRVCRYPKYLIRGDPERTAMMLTLRKSQRVRLSSMFRAFRERKIY